MAEQSKTNPASDGWNYTGEPIPNEDARKLVTLEETGMVWVGIRAWHHGERRWVNNGEPEKAKVIAWRDLEQPAKGFWLHGIFHLPEAL